MKPIMLIGKSNSGKTTTLTQVYDELRHLGAIDFCKPTLIGSPKPNKPDDFECILNYKGLKVAIYTMGDYSRKITQAMDKYNQLGCDVLIITSRDSFKLPQNKLDQFPERVVINKTNDNKADMQKIIQSI